MTRLVFRNVHQLQNPLLMRLPLRGRCFSPMPTPPEPLGHGDFGTHGSTFFPHNHFQAKPADVSFTAYGFTYLFLATYNNLLCTFREVDPLVKLRLLQNYRRSLYGCELWQL